MQTFRVDDMTCSHCVSAITKAVQAVDAAARVDVDLVQHLVHIQPTASNVTEVADAITEAGYTPAAVAGAARREAAPARSGGCCCGSGRSVCGV